MSFDTEIHLASIRQNELRNAATQHRSTSTSRRFRTRWGRQNRDQGARS
jgi:hypothetical protein